MLVIAGMAPVEDLIHGVAVRDPYRWLEDRNTPETEEWIREQQRRCDAYFAACPGMSILESRVRAHLDVETVDQPARAWNRYFYRKRRKGEEQACIYVRDIATADERLLVDPSEEGPLTSVGIYRISEDGRLLAFEIKRGGEDRKKIRIVDVEEGLTLPDGVELGYARGFSFTSNGDGYLYSHEIDESADENTIRRHHFGKPGEDEIVFRVPRTQGGKLVLVANTQWFGAIWIRPQDQENVADFSILPKNAAGNWTRVFREKRLPYSPVLCHERILAFVETKSKILSLVELSVSGEELRTLIPETHPAMRQFVITRGRLYMAYLDSRASAVDVFDLGGRKLNSLELPKDGTIQIIPGHSQEIEGFFYSYESFDRPPVIYEYDSATNTSIRWHERVDVRGKRRCHARDVGVPSTDGVIVPLTLIAQSNDAESPTPVIMTSYGGFGVALTAQFSVFVAIMIELGATLALPHIRGGGDFGKAWHDAARARNRQTAIDDFLAAADRLCQQGVTAPSQLGIFGGSNSGLLVGTAMTQRPELFGAVLCIAPLLDMVRYEYFDHAIKWRGEYGTVEDPDDFRALHAYSPYHHIAEDINYPPTLFVSGDRDERCNPAHVRKMAALLQQGVAQSSPVIVDYSEDRGHSPVLPLSVRVAALTRRIAFLCRELKICIPGGGLHEAHRD